MSDNNSDGQSEVLKKMFKSNHPLHTPKQIKGASLEELKSDERLWAAYERGWCDFVQSFMSSQLMQTETSMTLSEMSDMIRSEAMRRSKQETEGRERLVVPPKPASPERRPAIMKSSFDLGVVQPSVTVKPMSISVRGRGSIKPRIGDIFRESDRGSPWPATTSGHDLNTADGSATESWWSYRAGRFDGSFCRPFVARAVPPSLPPLRRAAPMPQTFASSVARDRVERSAVRIEITPPEPVNYVPTAAEFRVVNDDDV